MHCVACGYVVAAVATLVSGFASHMEAGLLTLQTFAIEKVIRHGEPLLATGLLVRQCSGAVWWRPGVLGADTEARPQEYDFDADGIESQERLALQRTYVLRRLGLSNDRDVRAAMSHTGA